MKRNTLKDTFTLLALTLTSSLIGCKSSPKAEPKASVNSPAPAAQEAQAVAPSLSDAQTNALTATLKAYEALRSALAQDKLGDVSALAAQLEVTIQAASEGAPQSVSAQLSVMREATLKLKDEALSSKGDEQRRLFGEVSKGVVTILSTHKSLAAGLHVFSCPMAQGYKKWVQPNSKLENPYMGGRMLRCGGRSELTP
jgi:Cu(I)/Ag(I) efflux system membrane fusion protein